MRIVTTSILAALLVVASSASAHAQVIGTFYWRLGSPSTNSLGSVLNITITQKGSLYVLEGFEAQCGGNPSLPLTGLAVVQPNGTIMFGMTSISDAGRGLHTRAYVNPANNFNGTWADNTGYYNQPFTFATSGAPLCPGNLRSDPMTGAPNPGAAGAPPQP